MCRWSGKRASEMAYINLLWAVYLRWFLESKMKMALRMQKFNIKLIKMESKFEIRAWHKETKSFLNIWPYEWQKTVFAGTQREGRCFNNEFELTPDGLNCNRIKGKSVFLTLDGTIVGLVPISETITQTVDYSDEYEIQLKSPFKSKSGDKLFEGDFVKATIIGTSGSKTVKGIVAYSQELGKFIVRYQSKRGWPLHEDMARYHEFVLLGNVFENSELDQ